jgi:hypothetical protein
MRRILMGSLLAIIFSTILCTSAAFAQKVDTEGKAWLGTCSDAAALNVTGIWKDPKWGALTLSQHQDSRQILGAGDGWNIFGVVSGNTVCLLFSDNKGRIAFSAKLTADPSGALDGGYVKGMLSDKSKTNPMHLVKMK